MAARAACWRLLTLAAMDGLSAFGLVSVTAMLVFYAYEKRSRWCILGFAVACMAGSLYGFLQGAWPFGVVEAIWAVVAIMRWRGTP
jgi:hypothetical protein